MDRRVQMVTAIMEADFERELSLVGLAQFVNLSPSRLHHLFKAEAGVAPACYLRALRLKKSKELLETTFLSVKQIMARVGVKDKSHFERGFKKAYGLTPAQHRAVYRLLASAAK